MAIRPLLGKRILVGVFHLFPVLPFAQGYVYGGIAALLLVAMPYIKVKKLTATLRLLEELAPKPISPVAERELEGLRVSLSRWRALTFLKAANAVTV